MIADLLAFYLVFVLGTVAIAIPYSVLIFALGLTVMESSAVVITLIGMIFVVIRLIGND